MGTAASLMQAVRGMVNQTQVSLIQDDLTALAVDAIVFYAAENLDLGAGFGSAIQSRGGEAIRKELAQIGGVRMGEAVITSGGRLNARHVIHACGPKFQEEDTERKLRDCVQSALRLAGEKGLETMAFPAMGAGFYGIPLALCSRVMLGTIRDYLRGDTSLREVVISLNDRREFDAFRNGMEKL